MPIDSVFHFTQPARNVQADEKKQTEEHGMSTQKTHFQFNDFFDELPVPGYYPGCITNARFRQSANGNQMIQVVYALQGVGPAHQLVADYFVVEGERASPTGIFLARRRLLQLYRACGIFPKQDQEIVPAKLLQARLQVRVEHEQWKGQPRLRVADYRPLESFHPADQIPF